MGLLDEAIRDHLELKRRRGADPSIVAREEHEALSPPPVGPEMPRYEAGEGETAADSTPAPDGLEGPGYVPRFAGAAPAQETAELDMALEMGEGPESKIGEEPGSDEGLEPALHPGDAPALGSFDAEGVPDEQAGVGLPEMIPGQERLSLE